ncbi:MAG: maleylpyruvate isomerase family mycothiol-dependent enzyme, partial [Candidatus Eisenbacteria bacterium]
MSEWNGMTYEAKDTMLRVVGEQAQGMFAMAEVPANWEAQTASAEWQVRDIIGHLVDVTEGYFTAFDTARSGGQAGDAYGVTGMAVRANDQAQAFRKIPQAELMERVRTDQAKMMGILEGLSEDDWSNLIVPHFYMGPLPSFFYPAFQLMDYGVHSWDIRQGLGRAHG